MPSDPVCLSPKFPRRSGFTVLELLTVLVIIAILAVLLIGATDKIQARVERYRCTGNLRTLHVAASNYMQQHGHWPQVNPALLKGSDSSPYYLRWVEVLEPFGAARKAWLCPTVTRKLGEPDWKKPETIRIDYAVTPFDSKQFTPFKWPKQPWFIEKGDVHGRGNLLIFPDGHVEDLKNMVGQ